MSSDTLTSLYEEMNRAVYKESAIREASFLDLTYDICGVPVRQLTPYTYLLLDFANSPFLKKGDELSDAELFNHICNFIWLLSPEFKENDGEAKKKFILEKLAQIDYVQAIKEISEFIKDMFMDAPPIREKVEKDKKYTPQHYAWIVGYIYTLSETFGWTDEYIVHLPIPRILQYNNIIYERKMTSSGKAAILVNNLSDPVFLKIKNEHMRLMKEKK